MSNYGPETFLLQFVVSRETLNRLHAFVELLLHWQTSLNLISSGTTKEIWKRHILDSAQLFNLVQGPGCLLDLGSGAGFPGIVLAILGRLNIKLIESNGKKCTFLREVTRTLNLDTEIIQTRIEEYKSPLLANYISARALAPLGKLLRYSAPLLSPDGRCLFLKGVDVETELTQARKNWKMTLRRHESLSDPNGIILDIGRITSIHGGQ